MISPFGPPPAKVEIAERVLRHTKVACALALLGRRPPGYTPEMWANHLMDSAPDDLEERLDRRIEKAAMQDEILSEVGGVGDENEAQAVLGATIQSLDVPKHVPPELVPKIRLLTDVWARATFQEMGERKLDMMSVFADRDAEVLREAGRAIYDLQDAIRKGSGKSPGQGLSFRGKVHMKRDGALILSVRDFR